MDQFLSLNLGTVHGTTATLAKVVTIFFCSLYDPNV